MGYPNTRHFPEPFRVRDTQFTALRVLPQKYMSLVRLSFAKRSTGAPKASDTKKKICSGALDNAETFWKQRAHKKWQQ